jgi:hypothetical protein
LLEAHSINGKIETDARRGDISLKIERRPVMSLLAPVELCLSVLGRFGSLCGIPISYVKAH